MAFNVAKTRLAVGRSLQRNGFLLTVLQPVYVEDVRTGEEAVQTWAVEKAATEEATRAQGKEREIRLVVAALVTQAGGGFGDVLDLAMGDELVLGEKRVSVLDPGAVSPVRKTDGSPDPVVYKVRAGVQEAA